MTGFLIYDDEGIKRNRWFADELTQKAQKHGVDLQLKIRCDEQLYCFETPDFVIVRTISPNTNLCFEQRGIPVFNNYKTSRCANNKWLTYLLANKLKIPVMRTLLPSGDKPGTVYPFILKSLNGHGGNEVFMVHNDCEYNALAHAYEDNFLIQEVCSDVGKDVRVYCLGERIVAAILRTSSSDFRSNFSLGGSATVFTPTESMVKTVKLLHNELNFSLAGVDFISHNGSWILNEIEDVVGTRMLYQCTSIDIANEYMQHIVKSITSKNEA